METRSTFLRRVAVQSRGVSILLATQSSPIESHGKQDAHPAKTRNDFSLTLVF